MHLCLCKNVNVFVFHTDWSLTITLFRSYIDISMIDNFPIPYRDQVCFILYAFFSFKRFFTETVMNFGGCL